MTDLEPPPLKETLERLRGMQGGDVLGLLLRVFHGLLGARPAAAASGLQEGLEVLIATYRERGQRLEESLDVEDGDGLDAQSPWVREDFVRLLDEVGRYLSVCAEAERQGAPSAEVMARFIREVLYEHLATLAHRRGWFLLEEVIPGQTEFNAAVHKAVGAKNVAGQVGLVIELVRVGRRAIDTGVVLEAANVVVGR